MTLARALALTLGLVAWGAIILLAAGIAGAGHGWITPLLVSVPLVLLYPFIFVRAVSARRSRRFDKMILVSAGLLNLFLIGHTLVFETVYFREAFHLNGGAMAAWILLWLGWQIAAIMTWLRGRSAAAL